MASSKSRRGFSGNAQASGRQHPRGHVCAVWVPPPRPPGNLRFLPLRRLHPLTEGQAGQLPRLGPFAGAGTGLSVSRAPPQLSNSGMWVPIMRRGNRGPCSRSRCPWAAPGYAPCRPPLSRRPSGGVGPLQSLEQSSIRVDKPQKMWNRGVTVGGKGSGRRWGKREGRGDPALKRRCRLPAQVRCGRRPCQPVRGLCPHLRLQAEVPFSPGPETWESRRADGGWKVRSRAPGRAPGDPERRRGLACGPPARLSPARVRG